MSTSSKLQYIVNEQGEKVYVILPIEEYERMLNELEDIEDVKLFDEAKKNKEPSMPIDEYVKDNYNPEFVEKILRGREDIKNGMGVKIDIEDQ